MTADKRIVKGNPLETRAYIGLGSNAGDRVSFIQQAMQLLKDVSAIKVSESSSLYETEPLKNKSNPWFVNAVAAIDTKLSAEELLDVCQDIEKRLNRFHEEKKEESKTTGNKQRIIDLDILFFGDEILDTDTLCLPHPQITKRAYALVPLLEIAPDLVHPQLGKTISQIHEDLPDPEQVFLYGTREEDHRFQ